MKNIMTFLSTLIITSTVFAQSPLLISKENPTATTKICNARVTLNRDSGRVIVEGYRNCNNITVQGNTTSVEISRTFSIDAVVSANPGEKISIKIDQLGTANEDDILVQF